MWGTTREDIEDIARADERERRTKRARYRSGEIVSDETLASESRFQRRARESRERAAKKALVPLDIFADTFRARMFRFLLLRGSITQADFMHEYHRIGCRQQSFANGFSSYIVTDRMASSKSTTSIRRVMRQTAIRNNSGTRKRVMGIEVTRYDGPKLLTWIGSEGDTFEERARNWIAKLPIAELDRAFEFCESILTKENLDDVRSERYAQAWVNFLASATSTVTKQTVNKRGKATCSQG